MLSSVYLVEYTLHQNLMIEIHTRNFDLHITVPSPNLAFLCRNLDYKPYSIILRKDNKSMITTNIMICTGIYSGRKRNVYTMKFKKKKCMSDV